MITKKKYIFFDLKAKWALKYKSFKYRLIVAFCIISIFPIVIMQVIAYYNTQAIVQSNVDKLMDANLVQTQKSVSMMLSSYKDLLYQTYTDDHIVSLVDQINSDQNIEVSRNQLRRTMSSLANVKPYVQSITVITSSGETVFYDKISASTVKSAWMDTIGISSEQLYKRLSLTNNMEILSTRFAAQFSAQKYYLFHMGHRIIDYKNVNKKNGVIILSIDEKILSDVCNQTLQQGRHRNNLNFLVDEQGKLVSFVDPSQIGMGVTRFPLSEKQQKEYYRQFIKQSGMLAGGYMAVRSLYDKDTGWTLVNVSDQSEAVSQMSNQLNLTISVLIISIFTLTTIIIFISNRLTASIGVVVRAMKTVEKGGLSVRVEKDKRMPQEIVTIAEQFNRMIENINNLINEVKTATEKQKNAEITALEAQINPHFLYNTLDTINWMAIDREQYEISNTINSLAHILRYGVDKSNSVVEIRQEVDWLKQYIFLQQTRLKNTFECQIHAETNVLQYHIHKLLFQPFVENAILHGLQGVECKAWLEITISEELDSIRIIIADNGKGMNEEMVQTLSSDSEVENEKKGHIGVCNAIGRLKMYYGDSSHVQILSKLGKGTTILIEIPKE